ncbi:MAG: hypothetical protein ACOWWM_15185 [Desulfobacterales bacterium]
MKTTIVMATILTILICLTATVVTAGSSLETSTIIPFYNALKAGDLNKARSFVGGSVLARLDRNMKSNGNYPTFIKSHYQNRALSSVELDLATHRKAVATIALEGPQNTNETIRWILEKQANGKWLIVDEMQP